MLMAVAVAARFDLRSGVVFLGLQSAVHSRQSAIRTPCQTRRTFNERSPCRLLLLLIFDPVTHCGHCSRTRAFIICPDSVFSYVFFGWVFIISLANTFGRRRGCSPFLGYLVEFSSIMLTIGGSSFNELNMSLGGCCAADRGRSCQQ